MAATYCTRTESSLYTVSHLADDLYKLDLISSALPEAFYKKLWVNIGKVNNKNNIHQS